MKQSEADPNDTHVAQIIDALDALLQRIDGYVAYLETARPQALASGDQRFIHRIERALDWSGALTELLETQALEHTMLLRHNAHQLGYARDGKMV